MLFNVNVPPCTSFRVSFLVLARSAKSLAPPASPAILSWSASWSTGTINPSGAATARPRLIRFLRMILSPPQVAFMVGNDLNASTTALEMNGRNVREPPCFCSNSALTDVRRATRPVTSTSTVLQACGISVTLRTMASAIIRRTGVSGTWVSCPSAEVSPTTGRASAAAVAWAAPLSTNFRMSSLVIRPPRPEPWIRDTSTECSWAKRRTAGDRRAWPAVAAAG